MNLGEQTALGGTLIHWGKNIWAWSDNSSAPNVRDMTSSQYYNFRTRANQWIEVMVQATWENDDLHWVTGNYEISLSGDRHGQFVIDEVGRIIPASQIGIVIPEVTLSLFRIGMPTMAVLPQTGPKKIMRLLSQKLVHWAGTRRKGNEKFFVAAVDQLPGRKGQARHYRH